MSTGDLFTEEWAHIFSYITINDKLNCRLVCKKFNQLAQQSIKETRVVVAFHRESYLPMFLSLLEDKISIKITPGHYFKLRKAVVSHEELATFAQELRRRCNALNCLITLELTIRYGLWVNPIIIPCTLNAYVSRLMVVKSSSGLVFNMNKVIVENSIYY